MNGGRTAMGQYNACPVLLSYAAQKQRGDFGGLMFRFLLAVVCAIGVAASAMAQAGAEQIIFADDFDRADADTVGNDWTGRGSTKIKDQALFFDLKEEEFRPRVERTFPIQERGKFTMSFVMDWLRESEATWSFHIQLGHSKEFPRLLAYKEDLAKGIAVNLLWGGKEPVNFEASGSFGYVRDGKFKPLFSLNDNQRSETVIDKPVITVTVDLDAGTYAVKCNDKTYSDLPFDNKVPIDTIRFISNGCSKNGFARNSIDAVKIVRHP
jgi:hypothetical protein